MTPDGDVANDLGGGSNDSRWMDNRRLTISRNEHFFSPGAIKDLCSAFSVSYHTLLNGGRSSERHVAL